MAQVGEWTVPAPPAEVLRYTRADVDAQRVQWDPGPWASVFARRPGLYHRLSTHAVVTGGIARSFVHSLAGGDALELFLATMAWGFGNAHYGPWRVERMLAPPEAEADLAAIVATVQRDGAGLGWRSLLLAHRVPWLGMAFGTKLLSFAGYGVLEPPRPVVLDARVRASLQRLAPGTVPPAGRTVWRSDYLRYLSLAEVWGAEPTWAQGPEVVEFALFAEARSVPSDPASADEDADAGEAAPGAV